LNGLAPPLSPLPSTACRRADPFCKTHLFYKAQDGEYSSPKPQNQASPHRARRTCDRQQSVAKAIICQISYQATRVEPIAAGAPVAAGQGLARSFSA
jgi:hypothetical protein